MSDETPSVDLTDQKTVAQIVLGFAVAGLVVYLLVDFVGTAGVLAELRTAEPTWLALACLSTMLCLVAWGKAWQIVLAVVGIEERFSSLVVTYFAATFANYVTPLGQAGGEPFIAYVLSRDTEASYQDSLASVVTADLLNLFPFVTFAGVGFAALLYRSSLPDTIEPLAGGLVVLSVGVPVFAAVGWRYRKRLAETGLGLVAPVARRTPRVTLSGLRERLRETETAFQRIATDRRALVEALSFSYVGWVFFALPLYLAAQSIGVELTVLLVLFIVPASTLAGIAPSPGGSGAISTALVVLIVALTAISRTDATAVAILYRVASYLFALLLGGGAALYVLKRN
ncbi:lysylphosphatidylglycerol synthase transmembrane domain-containing protein [Haloarcula nitratireducens]|uniref:Flippase-like domain-containing protein n=1 Tax=Haloarcula nitratireducens TaxID=2487749 RepID=A0AAW4PEL6_9EURY|nr:lysylphosphatidylglycerol synthase transmembrane domain-containing protein [Halomicroarcula nitratireducens]MBX0295707.1 flippase-like domain-containing protein [Halomicroarcula nitratireducens]